MFLDKFLDNKAQSGTIFRLLIDAIIMMAVLIIIIATLNYFNDFKRDVSKTKFVELVGAVVEAPSGQVIKSSNLFFSKGLEYSSDDLQELSHYPASCFSFQTNLTSAEITGGGTESLGGGTGISFKNDVETTVYAMCEVIEDSDCPAGCSGEPQEDYCDLVDCCNIECLFSFGKIIQSS